ncbi:MAG TPA: response regulator [Bacillota bacterium]|nr:response regulator [Bacillota bacterium]HPT87255.1 response regulator [Bacillota bacterium]
MIRVMIVDDDVIIRKGLSKNIGWSEAGFELAGTAADGEEAYRLFQEIQPDVVISDIKMPFLDGLGLARKIFSQTNDVKIILLTGYDEFDYAKQALELKIFEYILKPVDRECLLASVRRAAQELQQEREARRRVKESLPLLRQHFLNRLIHDQYHTEEEIREEVAFLELNLNVSCYIAVVLKIDDFTVDSALKNMTEQEVLKLNLADLCNHFLNGQAGAVLNPGGDELVLLIGSDGEVGLLTEYVLELAESIKETINQQYGLSVTMGIGKPVSSLIQIGGSYRAAKTATEFRHLFGKNQILNSADIGIPVEETLELPEIDTSLGIKIKTGLTDEALEIVSKLETDLLSRGFVSLMSARLIGIQLAMIVFQGAELGGETDGPAVNLQFSERCRQIQEGETVADIFAVVRKIIIEITETINRKRQSSASGLIAEAIHYMETHYSDEGLSLSEVAQAVHVSPVYLSIVFKKERNINFSDYLNEIRMNRAMEMLRNSDLKAYEVAERVGFSNPQYFSVCFKKFTGYSPSEFRKR